MKLKLVIMFVTLYIVMSFSQVGLAMALKVAPQRLVFRIDDPETTTQVVIVTNTSDKPIRVKVYPEMAPEQKQEEYLGDWIVVYPRLLSLQPGEKKYARFTVRTPEEIQDGEYRALLFFEEIYQQPENQEEAEGIELDFQLLTKLGINIYGQYGQILHRGSLEEVELLMEDGQLLIRGNFVNRGNAHLLMDARVIVTDEQGKIVAESQVPFFAVHRSVFRTFEDQLAVSGSGSYQVRIIFKQEDVIIDEYTGEFEIPSGID